MVVILLGGVSTYENLNDYVLMKMLPHIWNSRDLKKLIESEADQFMIDNRKEQEENVRYHSTVSARETDFAKRERWDNLGEKDGRETKQPL